jgi:hypothetical protein
MADNVPPPSSLVAPRSNHPITELNDNDVLLGRGTGARQFIGNERFRSLVAEYKEDYSSAPKKKEKEMIARELFEDIKWLGGRFLTLVETDTPVNDVVKKGEWYEVEESRALKKCKRALRDHRENRGWNDGRNGGLQVGQDTSRERNTASSSGVGIGITRDPASLAGGFVHGLPASRPSQLVPVLPSIMVGNTGPLVGDVRPLIFQATPFALQEQITLAQLMATNIFNPSGFNHSFHNQNDANILPSLHAPVGSRAQGLFHDMYRPVNEIEW